ATGGPGLVRAYPFSLPVALPISKERRFRVLYGDGCPPPNLPRINAAATERLAVLGWLVPEPTYQPVAGSERESCWRLRLRSRRLDRKSTRLNSSHVKISYAVFCL